MRYHLQLIRSLVEPATKLDQLRFSEVIPFPFRKIALILIICLIVGIVQGYYGLNTFGISHLLSSYSASEFEMAKLIIGLGGILQAILTPILYLLLTSLSFWAFLDDLRYRQGLVIAVISLFIFTVGELALLPFELFLGTSSTTSPFALGILSHYFTENEYIIHFFGQVSLFLIAVIAFQIYSFARIASNGKVLIALVSLSVHIVFILCSVLLVYLLNILLLN